MVHHSSHLQRITHPFDRNHGHILSLTSTAGFSFSCKCDACGEVADGLCYRCGDCNIDLHTHCASMPMTLAHRSHPHQLTLVFLVPYPSKCFTCNLCRSLGSGQWLYRCDLCEFDVHLGCAGMEQGRGPYPIPGPHDQHLQVQPPQRPPVQVQHNQYHGTGQFQEPGPGPNPMPHYAANNSYVTPNRPSTNTNTAVGGVLGSLILTSALGGTFQALGSRLTNALFGDSGGGNNGGDGGSGQSGGSSGSSGNDGGGYQTDFGAYEDLGGD